MHGRLEVLGVATCAAAGIGGRRPRHLLGVAGVAGGAGRRRLVGAWIAACRMREAQQRPVGIAVTARAVARDGHVARRHAQGDAVVVAACAVGGQRRVIEPGRLPAEGTVAGIALRRGRHVPDRQARRMHPVVAGPAGMRDHGGVIEARRRPGIGGVAGLAAAVAGDVVRVPAPGRLAVMAAGAGAAQPRVIDADDRQPGERIVAAAATAAGGDVISGLAAAAGAVVAAGAIRARNAVVIEYAGRRRQRCRAASRVSRTCECAAHSLRRARTQGPLVARGMAARAAAILSGEVACIFLFANPQTLAGVGLPFHAQFMTTHAGHRRHVLVPHDRAREGRKIAGAVAQLAGDVQRRTVGWV